MHFSLTEVYMKPLSLDLKERILAAIQEGKESMPKIAVRFAVSHKMVQKIKYQWRDTGTLQPQTQKVGRKRILTDKHGERIRHLISENPSVTLEQIRSKLKVNCCLTTIWLELQRQRQTFKKNSERQRTASSRRGGMSKKLEEKATST